MLYLFPDSLFGLFFGLPLLLQSYHVPRSVSVVVFSYSGLPHNRIIYFCYSGLSTLYVPMLLYRHTHVNFFIHFCKYLHFCLLLFTLAQHLHNARTMPSFLCKIHANFCALMKNFLNQCKNHANFRIH